MKRSLPFCLLLFMLAAHWAQAAFYQWTDANGVVHFTDNRKNIPQKYRQKAKKLNLPQEPSAVKGALPSQTAAPAPPAAAAPQAQQPQASMPGGHDEKWWRERFATLKQQFDKAQQKVAEDQGKLVELRRKRVLYHRAQDREAINALEAQLATDQTQLDEAQKQLDAFRDEAGKAYVPGEWLR